MNSDLKFKNHLNKLIRYHTQLVCYMIIAIGIGLSIIGANSSDQPVIFSILLNIGCGLVTSGVLTLLIFPAVENQDQDNIRLLIDKNGLRSISIHDKDGVLSIIADKKINKPKTLELINSGAWTGLETIINKNYSNCRILLPQPSDISRPKPNQLTQFEKLGAKIQYYSGSIVDFYCRVNDTVYLAQKIPGITGEKFILSEYSINGTYATILSELFDEIWNARLDTILIAETTAGITYSYQKKIITKILENYCTIIKRHCNLNKTIEVVIAVWTPHKKKRMTFYSYNKKEGRDPHAIRPYNMGVIGELQKLETEGSDNDFDFVGIYDSKDETNFKYLHIDSNTLDTTNLTLTNKTIEEQHWSGPNSTTKAMLAITLKNIKHQFFGALTFDFSENIEDSNITELIKLSINCRDSIKNILATSISTEYPIYLKLLETSELKEGNKNESF